MELALLLKVLADESRLRILNLLHDGSLNVGEMVMILGMSQANVSRNLQKLKHAKLIRSEKRAQRTYYQINQPSVEKYPLLRILLDEELILVDQCIKDRSKLKNYKHAV